MEQGRNYLGGVPVQNEKVENVPQVRMCLVDKQKVK